jgi:hypothetical protein
MFIDNIKNKAILFALILSLIIKCSLFIYFLNIDLFPLAGDQSKYWKLSEKIFSQEIFFNKEFGTMRVPLYPAFLAIIKLVSNNIYSIIFVQLLISFVNFFLIYKIGNLFSKDIAKISILLAVINLNLINGSIFVLTEAIFLPFFLSFIYFFLKDIEENKNNKLFLSIFLSAIFLGISTLIRPLAYYFFILIFITFVKKDFILNLKKFLIFIFVFSIVLSPWCFRNLHLFGYYKLTNSTGPNLTGYYLPYLESNNNDKLIISEVRKQNYKFLQKEIDYSQNPFLVNKKEIEFFKQKIENYSILTFAETWLEGNIKFLFSPPIVDTFYLLDIKKTNYSSINKNSFLEKSFIFIFNNENKILSYSLIISIILICILRFLAFIAIFTLNKKDFLKFFIFYLIIIINLVLTGPIGNARYRIVVEPIFIIMLSISIQYIYNKYKFPKK